MTAMRWMANRGFLKIFTALLLIVAIMFVSNYMVYKRSVSGIYDQVSENNTLVVRNIVRIFEESFANIRDMTETIQKLPYATWNATGVNSGADDMAEIYLMKRSLSEIVPRIDYIEEVVVFNNYSDLSVTTAGTIHLKELFRLKFSNPMYNYEFWTSFGQSTHATKVFPAGWYSQWSSDTGAVNQNPRKLLVVSSGNQLYNLNVLVFLDVNKLLEHVNQKAMMQGASLVILDKERNVVLSTEESLNLVGVLSELNGKPGQESTIKKTGYEYTIYETDYFTYINKVPYRFADLNPVKKANERIILIAIAFAVLLSGVLSLYLYKPMRILFKLMGGRDPREIDFRAISAGIVRLKEENEAFQARLDEADADLARNAFFDALSNRAPSREGEQRLRRMIAEQVRQPYYVLASFQLKPEGGEQEMTLDPGRALAAIRGGLQELDSRVTAFQAGEHMFLAAIGIGSPAEREMTVKRLRSFVKQAEKDAWSGFAVLAAVSRAYPARIEHLGQSYRDVAEGLARRNIGAKDAVVDVPAIRPVWRVYFPLDEAEKLPRYLAGGNLRECERLIDDIFAQNVERRIHYHQLRFIAKTMFYDMLKLLEAGEPKTILALETAFARRMEAAFGHEDIREALMQATQAMADNVRREVRSKLDAASVARYIDLHYMDHLHLDHMAEQMETSAKYFSNYFKKTFGVNFVDYVNKVRLSHAKDLLKNTDLSIAEIGEKTGYLNSTTFTTTFKKYAGLSPSEFRRSPTDVWPSGGSTTN